MTEEFKLQNINPNRGPPLRFKGRLLGRLSFTPLSGPAERMTIELWETAKGAWIAITRAVFTDGRPEALSARVVRVDDGSELERKHQIMEAFDWHDRARSMVRELGWKLRIDVE